MVLKAEMQHSLRLRVVSIEHVCKGMDHEDTYRGN